MTSCAWEGRRPIERPLPAEREREREREKSHNIVRKESGIRARDTVLKRAVNEMGNI